ncbi:MAG: hypothetical protein ACTHKS_18800 [Gaiellaceae bacterium]
MKRVLTAIALVVLLAAIGVSTALARGGKGTQTISATCTVNGGVTVHASNGQSAWVNNTHWVVLRFTGTFTPIVGTAQTFTKVYGHKRGFMRRTIDTCSGSSSDGTGTFAFTATVAKTTR